LSGSRGLDEREHREQREQRTSREPANGTELPRVPRRSGYKPDDSAKKSERCRSPRSHLSLLPVCHVASSSVALRMFAAGNVTTATLVTAVTNVYRASEGLSLAQRFARHESPVTTVYTHPSDDEMGSRLRSLPC